MKKYIEKYSLKLIKQYTYQYKKLSEFIYLNGGLLILVGGIIRNSIINQTTIDCDGEVYFLSKEKLETILNKDKKYKSIFTGISFGVFKLKYHKIDLSLPRSDKCIGLKHSDFEIEINPFQNYNISSKRRDFTINSIGYSIDYDIILDPNHGINDIKNKIIKAVDYNKFLEDPLRLLRMIYFQSKLNFKIDEKLQKLFDKENHLIKNISIERISNELKKILNCENIELAILNLSKINLKYFNIFRYIISSETSKLLIKNLNKLKKIEYKFIFIFMFIIKEDDENHESFQIFSRMPNVKIKDIKRWIISAKIIKNIFNNDNTKIIMEFLKILDSYNLLQESLIEITGIFGILFHDEEKQKNFNKIFLLFEYYKNIRSPKYVEKIINVCIKNYCIKEYQKQIFNLIAKKKSKIKNKEIQNIIINYCIK